MHLGVLKFSHQKYSIECDSISDKIIVKKENINFHIAHNYVEFEIIDRMNEHCVEAKIINLPNYDNMLFCGIIHHFYKTNIFVFSEKFNNQHLIQIPFHQEDNLNKMDIIQFKIVHFDNEGFKGVFIKKLGYFDDKMAFGHYIQDIFKLTENENTIDYYKYYQDKIENEKIQRYDLRTLYTFSIDPKGSKDIDDCFSLEIFEEYYILSIHIADVGFFIRKGSCLFEKILKQSFSIYLPHYVFHLLDRQLSNDLISLIQKKDRFAISTQIKLNKHDLSILDTKIIQSLIHVNHNLSYNEFQEICLNSFSKLKIPELERIKTDFCKISNHFKMDKLNIQSVEFNHTIQFHVQDFYHQCVENLMLLNNHIVAEKLSKKGLCMYRNHEFEENQISSLSSYFCHYFKIDSLEFKALNELLNKEETKENKLMNFLLTNLLNKATYNEENLKHFGLNSKCYTHFTSPIRRFPDLINHHLIFYDNYTKEELIELEKTINNCEKRITSIEYYLLNYKKFVYYLKNELNIINHIFNGYVYKFNHCSIYIFVPELYLSICAHISELTDCRCFFDVSKELFVDEENHDLVKIQIGQSVQVEIKKINYIMLQVKSKIIKID